MNKGNACISKFADLHDKICANLIQGFQGVGMHPCADVLLLQIRHGMGKACNDVRHAVLDGTDFFQQVAQFCYPAVCLGVGLACLVFCLSCSGCSFSHVCQIRDAVRLRPFPSSDALNLVLPLHST